MDFESLYARHAAGLEDFWGRRDNQLSCTRDFQVFGHAVRLAANHPVVLAAADFSAPLYSKAPPVDAPPLLISLVVRPAPSPLDPVPENLFNHIQYTGGDGWLAIQLGAWGHCQVDLPAGHALAVLSPELAAQPELVSRCLLNTLLNNLLTARGLSMLHATSLVQQSRVLLLIAPHGTGKSTTALRLALAGYPLMSDSQVYLSAQPGGLLLTGFPVGRVKLRRDMLPDFPSLYALLAPEEVRGETKFTLDLRRLDPALVCDTAVQPDRVELCLLTRHSGATTTLRPAARAEVLDVAMLNSLHYDRAEAWRPNVAGIERLVDMARSHHLAVGTDPQSLLDVVNGIQDISSTDTHLAART
jgi:hypothetical protein